MKHITYHNNIAYKVHRSIPRHNFTDSTDRVNMKVVQMWRDYLDCDHVLQNQTHFIFCETIPEVELEMED